MPTLEERVALLEGRVQDQAAFISIVHTTGAEVRQSIHDLGGELRPQMAGLLAEVSSLRSDVGNLHRTTSDLRSDMDRRFGWLIGVVVTGFVVTIGAVTGALWAVLQTIR
jgi:hypothetical protein